MSRHHHISITILLFLLFCYSCHNDNNSNIANQKLVNIIVQYKDQEGLHIDYGAKIFIYYGIYSMNIAEFTYSPNGVLVYGNKEIIPDIKTIVQKENTLLEISNKEKVTIITESFYYKGRTTSDSFSPDDTPIKINLTFEE